MDDPGRQGDLRSSVGAKKEKLREMAQAVHQFERRTLNSRVAEEVAQHEPFVLRGPAVDPDEELAQGAEANVDGGSGSTSAIAEGPVQKGIDRVDHVPDQFLGS